MERQSYKNALHFVCISISYCTAHSVLYSSFSAAHLVLYSSFRTVQLIWYSSFRTVQLIWYCTAHSVLYSSFRTLQLIYYCTAQNCANKNKQRFHFQRDYRNLLGWKMCLRMTNFEALVRAVLREYEALVTVMFGAPHPLPPFIPRLTNSISSCLG